MAQFTGFQGNILDTTPLKPNTAHGGDDLSISELSTTPQFRWMGETAPATPRNEPEEVQDLSTSFQEESPEKDLEVSFDETLRFEASALEEGDAEADRTQTVQPTSHNNEAQELDLKYTLKTMNKTVLQLNGFLKACIPKFERMQSAIETWDGLSKQYNQIMIETERTAQILEDNTWPGSVQEEIRYRDSIADEEQRQREEEIQRELEMQREEARRLEREKERLEKEQMAKKQPTVRGRGRGRGSAIPTRGMAASDSSAGRLVGRGSGIGRGISASSFHRPTSSTSSRGAISSISRGRFG